MKFSISINAKALADAVYQVKQVLYRGHGPILLVAGERLAIQCSYGADVMLTHVDYENLGSDLSEAYGLAKTIQGVCHAYGDQQITLSIKQDELTINAPDSVMATKNDDSPRQDSFPIPAPYRDWFDPGLEQFKLLIRKTIHAVSTDGGRPNLCGGFLQYKDGFLHLSTTDGHRIAQAKIQLESAPAWLNSGLILSHKTMKIIVSPATKEHIRLFFQDNSFMWETPHSLSASQPVAGTYPDFEHVMPSFDSSKVLTVELLPLLKIIKNIPHVRAKREEVVLQFRIQKEQLFIECAVFLEVYGVIDLRGTNRTGKTFRLAARYLLDVLLALQSTFVDIQPNGDDGPILFKSEVRLHQKFDATFAIMQRRN